MSISQILKRAMFEKQIRTTALARHVGLPQPTLHRIVEGLSPNPHPSSLTPLANYFGLTIAQLRGIEPIPWLSPAALNHDLFEIPILPWDLLKEWPAVLKNSALITNLEKTVIQRKKVGSQAFAVTLADVSMEPYFIKGAVLLFDPDINPRDRCFLIVCLKKTQTFVFRQLVVHGKFFYLKPLNFDLQNFPLTKIEKDDKILGVLVQAQQDYS